MKIAVFHNFLDNIGGAEIVTLTLARELNADVYTTNLDREKIKKMGFSDIKIKSIGKVPINAPFRHQLALFRFRILNLKRKYDFFIVSGDWAASAVVNNKPNLWYVHSPPRELWDLYPYIRKNFLPFYKKPIYDLWVLYNRVLYNDYIKKVNSLVCNSKNTQGRLRKFLKKDATIVNPPIDTAQYQYRKPKGYWLSVSRLLYHKRIDIQIKAFTRLPEEKLIIVGCYEKSKHFQEYSDYIKKIKPKNVEIRSWVTKEELIRLYSECKGFITTSRDEDFGMNVVEAMASGKPVVAPDEGGYKESVIDNKTGILIDDIDSDKIVSAIKKINKDIEKDPERYKEACIKQSKKFDTDTFIKKIKENMQV